MELKLFMYLTVLVKRIVNAPNMAEEFRERYGIRESFVVYIGRLHRLKGVDILIKAMSIAVKEYPRLRAVIIGPGDQKTLQRTCTEIGDRETMLCFLGT